jgi:hypothetical protein
VGLDKEIAARLADARPAELQRIGYGEWRAMLDDTDVRQVVGGRQAVSRSQLRP